jgi:hypothetical protein
MRIGTVVEKQRKMSKMSRKLAWENYMPAMN